MKQRKDKVISYEERIKIQNLNKFINPKQVSIKDIKSTDGLPLGYVNGKKFKSVGSITTDGEQALGEKQK